MDTRARIVAEADRLFYERGYEATSFADVADAVGISRGNFYHHFKSKDAILEAVIGLRLEGTRALLQRWEAEAAAPADGIRAFIRIVVRNQASIMRHGCPVGTLCSELSKLEHPGLAQATQLFVLFREWLGRQFERLGRGADADALAMHVLAFSQGVSALTQAFGDVQFVQREVERMESWLDAMAANAPASTAG